MMKRLFSPRVIIPFAVMMLMISFYSCSENPVTPPSEEPFELDSARFEWDIDTLNGYGILRYCIYAEDTNDVYLLNIHQEYLLNIKDEQKIYYNFYDFNAECLNGAGNNVYIGGSKINSSGQHVPHIRKFTNGSFQDIYFPEIDTINIDAVKYIYVNQLSEIWVMTLYFFIKYDGSKFTYYRIPLPENSILFNGQILEDQDNSLKAFGWEVKWEGKHRNDYSYIFEFRDNYWERIWQNTWDPATEDFILMNVFNKRIITSYSSVIGNKIFEFDGSNFINVLSINLVDGYIGISGIAGNSYNNFLFPGYIQGMGYFTIHWNGNKPSREFSYFGYDAYYYRLNDNKYWVVLNSLYGYQILICKGNRKK